MIEYSNQNPRVCVIGRCDFSSGIGLLTFAFAEAFSRYFPTCILPTTPERRQDEIVTLPNGRELPVWRGECVDTSIFVDVLWNGTYDYNYTLVPETGLRLACLVWDSTDLPSEWVNILNTRFDAAVCTSPHLRQMAIESGVTIPCIIVPPPLDLEPLLHRPFRPVGSPLRVGCVAAFHPRKGTTLLVDAFCSAFGERDDVELYIHSNLAFPGVVDSVRRKLEVLKIENVVISNEHLSVEKKVELIETFDIFANLSRGEGYSIGPREALALGKACVLSRVGGHQELAGTPGVFMVEPLVSVPARFPEIDNRVFGEQQMVRACDAVAALRSAVAYLNSERSFSDVNVRRERAADFSFSRLSQSVAELVKPELALFKKANAPPPEVWIEKDYFKVQKKRVRPDAKIEANHNRVVQLHDGGFFSIFNVFMSHLVWDVRDDRVHRTLPDWDVGRFLDRVDGGNVLSFCYGQAEDENIWTKLFEPLFGLTEDEMNDEASLYRGASLPEHPFNGDREPLLTYVNAAILYERRWFPRWRKEYNKVFRDHVQLRAPLQQQIEDFIATHFRGNKVFGAHVRHPSHTVEQPGAVIATANDYIESIYSEVERSGLKRSSASWRVFLATDQDRVVERFQSEFGQRLCLWSEARRTTAREDGKFDAAAEKNVDGYQLQHIVARDRNNWSVSMAEEVLRDAYLMAQCKSLLHVVSNVSTAVSYINPDCELLYLNKSGP